MAHLTDHELEYIVRWAAANGATVSLDGEVGFGRPCVGILVGSHYADYDFDTMDWRPTDAYHKHDCLAVLGLGPDAERQLYEWVRWIDEHGGRITTEARTDNRDMLDVLFYGLTKSQVVF